MSNSLQYEKSPYLRDHADNPVNWYPWCDEALEKAIKEDKPIFLSVGYSTCHWCHVMAHESFENTKIADILNKYYVSIKVDREERPDIDSVYMKVCTLINGSGGWPLTALLTPEQKPFYAAAYLPPENSAGQLGLASLLTAVASKWRNDRADIEKSAAEITAQLIKKPLLSRAKADGEFLKSAAEQLAASYDKEYGGFGVSPKFPTPQNLLFLLRYGKANGNRALREIVDGTLKAMYRGGIYDHLGGGFCRYSTDREWLAPHFEKTLYDNALLAYTYIEAWQSGHYALYREVAENTLDYCMRELSGDNGGYFCGSDADSGGREGAYYLFTVEEVKKALGDTDGKNLCDCYDITAEGNFGKESIPNLLINTRWQLIPEGYDGLREKLRLYRESRMSLRRDEKQLTAWNGLMLMALAKAAAVFEDARYLNAAHELAEFMGKSFCENGKLKARLCGGELKFDAQLDDYVFYALGLLELYETDHDASHIITALSLAGTVEKHFLSASGFCYRTSDASEKLIARPSEIYDSAMPSGNSGAAVLFDRLYRLTGRQEMRDLRDKMLLYVCGFSGKYTAGCPFALCALVSAVFPTKQVVFALTDEKLPEAIKTVTAGYSPELTVLIKTPANAEILHKIAPFTEKAEPTDGKATLYVCENGILGTGITL